MSVVLAGHYHVIQPLGRGGFGQTFLARDDHLPGKPLCVVKQLQMRSSTPQSLLVAKRLFDLEAETLYRLGNHDQIPRLFAHFEQRGEFYLVQEFIAGESLSEELSCRSPLSEAEVMALLRDILQVLAFVHQQGVIHRDIKPSNLIRRQNDRKFVLIDFGAVKQVSVQTLSSLEQTSFTIAIGSPGYMPVEQLSCQPHLSSDIYAVGMVALQSLTGILPKDLPIDPQTGEFYCALLGSRLSIRPAFAALLDRMVRYDYRQRYENAAVALQALAAISSVEEGDNHAAPDDVVVSSPLTLAQPLDLDLTLPPNLELALAVLQPLEAQIPPNRVTATSSRLSTQEYRNRQALLSKVNHYWIKGVLESSLHDRVLIQLGLESRPSAVTSPWHMAIATANRPPTPLSPGTPIISIFDQLGTGRTLLILGEPGAGKTTTLLQLTRDLIARAQQDVHHLIPVVLNLSSWVGGKQTIAQWVIEELNSKYQVPKAIGRTWVKQQQLLLLLDGLDEVRAEYRDTCVVALNAFEQECGTEMVVCSRVKDYEALNHRLNVQSAIYLRSLTLEQIHHYLNHLSADVSGLRTLLKADRALQELAQSPLILNIMVLAYEGMHTADFPQDLSQDSNQASSAKVVEAHRQQLFDTYIDRMLQRRDIGTRYTNTQTIRWLSWLAKQLIDTSQTVFLIERIQTSWLRIAKQRWSYVVISSLTAGLVQGLIFGLTLGFRHWFSVAVTVWLVTSLSNIPLVEAILKTEQMPPSPTQARLKRLVYTVYTALGTGLFAGFIAGIEHTFTDGLLAGSIVGFSSGLLDWCLNGTIAQSFIRPVEALKWSWRSIKPQLIFYLLGSAPLGLVLGQIGVLGNTPIQGLLLSLLGGLIWGVLTGLGSGSEIATRIVPNQGIWQSAKTAILVALISTLVLLLIVQLLNQFIHISPAIGAFHGLFIGYLMGGTACIVHACLRIVLWRFGCIPWNYAHFLNDCCNRIFLQRVGGGYIFIHRLLMEHFAQINSEDQK